MSSTNDDGFKRDERYGKLFKLRWSILRLNGDYGYDIADRDLSALDIQSHPHPSVLSFVKCVSFLMYVFSFGGYQLQWCCVMSCFLRVKSTDTNSNFKIVGMIERWWCTWHCRPRSLCVDTEVPGRVRRWLSGVRQAHTRPVDSTHLQANVRAVLPTVAVWPCSHRKR